MRQPSSLLRLGAVVSSLLLAGGFVSYRAGAFDSLMRSNAEPAANESAEAENTETSDQHPIYLIDGTSKSAAIFRGSLPTQQPQPGTSQRQPTVMSSSKS